VFELSGPERLTDAELADRISAVAGRTVRAVEISLDQLRQGMVAAGMPAAQAGWVVDLYAHYRAGGADGEPRELEGLTGRPARRVDAYLSEVATAFARPAPSAPAAPPLSPDQAKAFVREHFERFVNRKDIDVGRVNFAADFIDHGADVPPGTPPGPAGAMQYVGQAVARFPDLHVTIHDMVAEGDRVVVRNTWTATDTTTGRRLQFGGIVIWRLAGRQLAERWAYLEPPRPA
jgi:predicted ester cyclase